ncbi:LysE family translocator [Salidesulfovibrio brasiliensis]|uniref:LysE family translocator n=1 Tax=Salidesulfovibrio brasiliensis TaxID=221711 RepID=UPI000AAD6155|nr:LysE family translocator [Salidesulfovibrio brasiliensis]
MIDITQLSIFAGSVFLLALTPGPDILYVLARGLAQGRKAGLCAAAGFNLGVIVHTLFAALGISAVLAASATAFMVIKFAGAAYLIYIGIMMLRASGASGAINGDRRRIPLGVIFRQSIVANVLNPKVALFFLAFLPQFTDPDKGPVAVQMLVLGGVFMLVSFCVFAAVALFSGVVGNRLRRSPKVERGLNMGAGGLLVGLGLTLAFSDVR